MLRCSILILQASTCCNHYTVCCNPYKATSRSNNRADSLLRFNLFSICAVCMFILKLYALYYFFSDSSCLFFHFPEFLAKKISNNIKLSSYKFSFKLKFLIFSISTTLYHITLKI